MMGKRAKEAEEKRESAQLAREDSDWLLMVSEICVVEKQELLMDHMDRESEFK